MATEIRDLIHLHSSVEHLSNSHICLMHLGWEQCRPGYSYTNQRNLYLVHFIRAGKGTLTIDSTVHHLQAGDIFLIRPNQIATYAADQTDPWTYYYFAFQGAFANELLQRTAFRNNTVYFTMHSEQLAEQIIEASSRMEHEQPVDIFGLQQLFVFFQTIMQESERYIPTLPHTHRYIIRAQHYIHEHYATPLRIADLAKALHVDRSYLYRLFTSHLGISPDAYLMQYRLEKAKELLSTTNIPAQQVAVSVGFRNYSAFYKAFVKQNGCSPAQYRQRQLNTEINTNDCFVQSSIPFSSKPPIDKLKVASEWDT